MHKIRLLTVEAMPKRILPLEPTEAFVSKIHGEASRVFAGLRPYKTIRLTSGQSVFWAPKSKTTGLYFTVDEDTKLVSFVYFYQSLNAPGFPSNLAAESLAFTFSKGFENRGVLVNIFFDHLLQERKFVLTDAEYTSDGERYWNIQYARAISSPEQYGVVSVDTELGTWSILDRPTLKLLKDKYWGDSDAFKRWRFGVYLKSEEESIKSKLGLA